MGRLHNSTVGVTMAPMEAKAHVEVDFNHTPDGTHTLTSRSDVIEPVELAPGDIVIATDGDDERFAVIDSIDGDILALRVMWQAAVPAS